MKQFIYTKEEAQNFFFTSDTHFNHENIIKYCNRPFESIKEHDEELIKRWNEKVPEDGIVFHLGDVGFGNKQYINNLLNRLHGKIILIIGNHDWRNIIHEQAERFDIITQQINMKIGKQHIILNHFPLLCFSGVYKKDYPSWQLFGHVHSGPLSTEGLDNVRLKMLFNTQYDVGVDNNNFTPISYNELTQKIMQQKLNTV